MAYVVKEGEANPAKTWFVSTSGPPSEDERTVTEGAAGDLLRGVIVHRRGPADRGLVVADPDPATGEVYVRFADAVHAEACKVGDVAVVRERRAASAALREAAEKLHAVVCAAECFKGWDDEKTSIDDVSSGRAPPRWWEHDARLRCDVDWVGHVARKCVAYRNVLSSDAMSRCAWESLEAVLDVAAVLFGPRAPEVATILLVQIFAFSDLHGLPDDGQRRYSRAARRKCERLADLAKDPRAVFASGWVELPWCEGDKSMRYDATLLLAEATQHLANVIAAGGDDEAAEDAYREAIRLAESTGAAGERKLMTAHNDLSGLFAVAALGAPGSELRRLRRAADYALGDAAVGKMNHALRHACAALRLAERTFGRVNSATARMHYAVGTLLKDCFRWSSAFHHLAQAALLSYHVYAGHMGRADHPEVRNCVDGLNDCMKRFAVGDLRAAALDDDVEAGVDPDASRARCSAADCENVERSDAPRFDRCAKCQCVKYCSRACQVADWTSAHRAACARTAPMLANLAEARDLKKKLDGAKPAGRVKKMMVDVNAARAAERKAKRAPPPPEGADLDPPSDARPSPPPPAAAPMDVDAAP